MARFIAVHSLTWTEEYIKGLLETYRKEPPQMPPGIALHYTWCDFGSGKFVCEWEGPSKEAIEQTLKAMETPVEAVYPVRRLDWAKLALEA